LEDNLQFNYFVYDLWLSVNIEIPGLQVAETENEKPDVEINLGSFPNGLIRKNNQPVELYYLDQGNDQSETPHLVVNTIANGKFFHFRYDVGVEFICDSHATTVWGQWDESLNLNDIVGYLLGPILGFLLRVRGITCLHASGIVVNGKALALVGASGVGKSTLAAAFATEGHTVLTDDVMPLVFKKEILHAVAGYPHIRLYPKSFKNLKGIPNELPELMSNSDKCFLDLTTTSYQFQCGSVPLKIIYILDWDIDNTLENVKISSVAPSKAVSLLAANTYRNELLNSEMKSNEFLFLGRLASLIPMKKIQPVDDIAAIPELVEAILSDNQTV
jgi:hypothetical protein